MISQVIEMEKIVEQGLLYDFYGELLTEHQKSIYEDVVFNDLSLSEIAKEKGISRQGVHDMIKRCDKILNGYEEKLGLVKKFIKTRELVEEINSLTGEFLETEDKELIKRVGRISNDILKLV
nr:YlxM family DNA-binding protein [uncultured Clostridium sp.]